MDSIRLSNADRLELSEMKHEGSREATEMYEATKKSRAKSQADATARREGKLRKTTGDAEEEPRQRQANNRQELEEINRERVALEQVEQGGDDQATSNSEPLTAAEEQKLRELLNET